MAHSTLTSRQYRSKPQEILSFLPSEMKPRIKMLPSRNTFPSLPLPSTPSPTLLPNRAPTPRVSLREDTHTHRHILQLSAASNLFKPLCFSSESSALEMDLPQRIKFCCLPAFSTSKSQSSPNRLERHTRIQPLQPYKPHSKPHSYRSARSLDNIRTPDTEETPAPLLSPSPAPYPCTLYQTSLLSADNCCNTVRGFSLSGPINISLLETALDTAAAKHGLLYATFSLGDAPSFRLNPLDKRIQLRIEQKSAAGYKTDELLELGVSANFSHLLFSQSESAHPLLKAWVYSFGANEHIMVLSSPAVVCDSYSLTLLMRQTCHIYSQLIKASKSTGKFRTQQSMLLPTPAKKKSVSDAVPSIKLSFSQITAREANFLKLTPLPDALLAWNKHLLVPSSDRLVSQARVPHSFSKEGKSAVTKPRLRSAMQKSASNSKSSDFLILEIDADMTSSFLELMQVRGSHGIPEREQLCILCLAAYSLLLAVYFRGLSEHTLTSGVVAKEGISFAKKPQRIPQQSSLLFNHEKIQLKSANKRDSRTRPEACIFTIGLSNSCRYLSPPLCSLLAPMTYLSYFKVDILDCHTFYDLLLSIAKSLIFSTAHSHIPISHVREALDMKLPEVQFSFLHQNEMQQVSSPSEHFFPGVCLGVQEHCVSKLGPHCYLSPLNGRSDDRCGLEMIAWECPNSRDIGGGFKFDPARISKSVVHELRNKLSETIEFVVSDLDTTLLELLRMLT